MKKKNFEIISSDISNELNIAYQNDFVLLIVRLTCLLARAHLDGKLNINFGPP